VSYAAKILCVLSKVCTFLYRLSAISDFLMAYIKEKYFCAKLCFNSTTRISKIHEIPESAYVEIVMEEHRLLSDFLDSNWVKGLLKTVNL